MTTEDHDVVHICTCSSLAKFIRAHGLPVTIAIPGSGISFTITAVKEIRTAGKTAIAMARAMGNGMACK